MNIQMYKDILKNKSDEVIKERLSDELEKIKFLESIYMTGGENSYFSKEFRNAALEERQELCQLTSALYSLLRERGVPTN